MDLGGLRVFRGYCVQYNDNLAEIMEAATDEVLGRAEAEEFSPRQAAYPTGVGRVVEAEIGRGYR